MDQNGVVNCPQCARMLSLLTGCNHITCVCGAQFCYLCGERWPNCDCEMYGHHDQMLAIHLRPGRKPERWRRERRVVPVPTGEFVFHTIPQLRPAPGEQPLAWQIPRRRMFEPGRRASGVRASGGSMAQNAPAPERPERPVPQPARERPVERPIERHVYRRAAEPMNARRPINRWATEPVNPQELVNGQVVDSTQRAINRWAVDHILTTTELANTWRRINRQATEPANNTPGSTFRPFVDDMQDTLREIEEENLTPQPTRL
ncbi:hypothetical protein EDB80DRAFT_87264 [Ilyonectria destructans]|nr:hypothetical protein EDB80DRAFT_87264 [Ilyonectria destructans]